MPHTSGRLSGPDGGTVCGKERLFMKHRVRMLLLAALVLAAASMTVEGVATAASAPSCGSKVLKSNGKARTCRFADEFSGTKLDPKKWSVQQTAVSGHSGDEADCWVNSP